MLALFGRARGDDLPQARGLGRPRGGRGVVRGPAVRPRSLKLEEIPRGEFGRKLEDEVKKFQDTQRSFTQKIESLQAEQAGKKKSLFAEMEKKLKEELDKKSKRQVDRTVDHAVWSRSDWRPLPGDGMDFTSKTAPGLFFRKMIRKDVQKVSLDADMIRLLLAIDEHKSLYQIAAEVEMDAADLQNHPPAPARAGPHPNRSTAMRRFWTAPSCRLCGLNLSRAIGPMAQIVIEDRLTEMRLDPAGIPLDQAAELVNRIALEIPDEANRILFKKAMIPLINQANP